MGHRTRFCENACVCTVFLNSAFCCTVCTHTNAVRLRIFWSFFKVMQLKWKDLLKAGFQCMPQTFYVVEFSNRWCKTIIHFGKQAKMIVKNLTLFSRWSNVVFFQFRRIWVDNSIFMFECDCFVQRLSKIPPKMFILFLFWWIFPNPKDILMQSLRCFKQSIWIPATISYVKSKHWRWPQQGH